MYSKKGIFFFVFFYFLFSCGISAQEKSRYTSLRNEAYFLRKLDSFPALVKNKSLVLQPAICAIRSHCNYVSPFDGASFREEALGYSVRRKSEYAKLLTMMATALDYYRGNQFDSSLLYWKRALQFAVDNKFAAEELHDVRPSLNNQFFLQGDYVAALQISADGLRKAEYLKDYNRIAHFNNVIGFIHLKQKNLREAAGYYFAELATGKKISDSLIQAHAFCNLADLGIAYQWYDSTLHWLDSSVSLYRSYEAVHKERSTFNLVEREAYIACKQACVQKLKADFGSARQTISISLAAVNMKTSVNEYDKAEYLISAGDIYNHLGERDSALFFLRKGLVIAQQIRHREYTRDAYQQLANSFAGMKNYDSAWYYNSLFSLLRDSINNENDQRDIYQREAIIQTERQQAVYEAKLEKQKLWRNILIGLSLFIVIIAGLLYNRYRLQQKNKLQQEVLASAIRAQDEERKRIAADLHDGLGAVLSAAKLKLSAAEENLPNDNKEKDKLKDTLALLDDAVAEMKDIAYNIMPATLSRLGLHAALQNLVTRINAKSGLQINYSAHGMNERMDQLIEVSIYRIVLECINNVVKHAGASHATVQLVKYPDYINISVEDDGKGFDAAGKNLQGNGLSNISSRISTLKGRLIIDSKPGSGSTILIDIPCKT